MKSPKEIENAKPSQVARRVPRLVDFAKDDLAVSVPIEPGSDKHVRVLRNEGPPRATNVAIKMRDGKPMVFFTDGSLRESLGGNARLKMSPRQKRKALKHLRRTLKARRTAR